MGTGLGWSREKSPKKKGRAFFMSHPLNTTWVLWEHKAVTKVRFCQCLESFATPSSGYNSSPVGEVHFLLLEFMITFFYPSALLFVFSLMCIFHKLSLLQIDGRLEVFNA